MVDYTTMLECRRQGGCTVISSHSTAISTDIVSMIRQKRNHCVQIRYIPLTKCFNVQVGGSNNIIVIAVIPDCHFRAEETTQLINFQSVIRYEGMPVCVVDICNSRGLNIIIRPP